MEDLPQSETELIAEAKRLIALLTDNPKFANLPVSADEMRKRLDKFIAARDAVTSVNIALIQAEAAVQKALDDLNDAWQRQKKVHGESLAPPIQWH